MAQAGRFIMTIEQDDDSFLSRWSKRKLESDDEVQQGEQEAKQSTEPESLETETPLEQTTEADKPIWQQRDADPLVKKQALHDLFKQSEFGVLDGLNEYDEDYTSFPRLGNVVTREMKRMLELAEQKTRPDADAKEQQQASSQQAEQQDDPADSESTEGEDIKRV
jgi:hypothetical protein